MPFTIWVVLVEKDVAVDCIGLDEAQRTWDVLERSGFRMVSARP